MGVDWRYVILHDTLVEAPVNLVNIPEDVADVDRCV